MALIHSKAFVECRDSVFNGQINDVNKKEAIGMKLAFVFIN